MTDNTLVERALHTSSTWPLIFLHFNLKTESVVSFLPSQLIGCTCTVGMDVTMYGFIMSCFL